MSRSTVPMEPVMQQRVTTSLDVQPDRGFAAGAPSLLADAFAQRLQQDGVVGALAFLNGRTRFRFTGLYRVVSPSLHNVALFDRENPTLNVSGAVCALEDSYCSIVCASGDPFAIADSRDDPRIAHHSKRDFIQSYAGVPVRQTGGRVLGTLCHFDGRPRLLPAGELSVLTSLAPLFANCLVVDA